MHKILLLNGPNLDMLGTREPEVYGRATLADLEERFVEYAREHGAEATCLQSNSEAELIEAIHDARTLFDGIVYNPGAHTHYSYALRDAVGSIDTPVVEVHISDIDEREPFRRISVIAPACIAQVKGLGFDGYLRAFDILQNARDPERLGEGFEERLGAKGAIVCAPPEGASADHDAEDAAPATPAQADDAPRARQQLVQFVCERTGIDALLVRDTSNIHWITGFDGVFDEERAHALLVSEKGVALHTDSRYSNAMRTAAERANSAVAVNDDRVSHAAFAKDALSHDGAPFTGKIGFEDSVAYAEFVRTGQVFEGAELVPTTDVVVGLRAVKDEGEIARLRAAQAITDAAFRHIIGFMRPGMTEREVQMELDYYMLRHGADGLAFASIVASGANGADPHAIPGASVLEAGQCVVMDFGARARGYCSDMTRTVFLGEPDAEKAHAWEVLRRANETVEAMLAPGVTGKQAHETAERVLAEGGFAGRMGHGLGHGVGIDVHELPVLNPRNDSPLVEGNVVTVEPGIYLPGQFGMRLEDCGVIARDGYHPFSEISHEMVVI